MMRNSEERVKIISSNLTRAKTYKSVGDDQYELKYLLWALQDISRLILLWRNGEDVDNAIIEGYARRGCRASERVHELVMLIEDERI